MRDGAEQPPVSLHVETSGCRESAPCHSRSQGTGDQAIDTREDETSNALSVRWTLSLGVAFRPELSRYVALTERWSEGATGETQHFVWVGSARAVVPQASYQSFCEPESGIEPLTYALREGHMPYGPTGTV